MCGLSLLFCQANGGRNTCRESSTPRRRDLASQLLVGLHPGSPGLPPPWWLCPATASSCRTARKVPGTCSALGGRRAGVAALPLRRPRFTPAAGEAPPEETGRGLGSFDYLIAADTNPIFLLFQSSQLSPHFHSGPVTGAPAGGLHAERQPRGERACRRWCRPGPRAPAFVSTRAPPSP